MGQTTATPGTLIAGRRRAGTPPARREPDISDLDQELDREAPIGEDRPVSRPQ